MIKIKIQSNLNESIDKQEMKGWVVRYSNYASEKMFSLDFPDPTDPLNRKVYGNETNLGFSFIIPKRKNKNNTSVIVQDMTPKLGTRYYYYRKVFTDPQIALREAERFIGPGRIINVSTDYVFLQAKSDDHDMATELYQLADIMWISRDGNDFKQYVKTQSDWNTADYFGNNLKENRKFNESLDPKEFNREWKCHGGQHSEESLINFINYNFKDIERKFDQIRADLEID